MKLVVGLTESAFRISEAVEAELFWSVGTEGFRAVEVEIGCTTAAFIVVVTAVVDASVAVDSDG